jgi:hypothetical protein
MEILQSPGKVILLEPASDKAPLSSACVQLLQTKNNLILNNL